MDTSLKFHDAVLVGKVYLGQWSKTLSIPFQECPHFQAICPTRQLSAFIYES